MPGDILPAIRRELARNRDPVNCKGKAMLCKQGGGFDEQTVGALLQRQGCHNGRRSVLGVLGSCEGAVIQEEERGRSKYPWPN